MYDDRMYDDEEEEEVENNADKGIGFLTKGTKYILIGILAVILIGIGSMLPKINWKLPKRRSHEITLVEAYVARKEITQIDGQDVYLLHTEDRDGNEIIYEISQEALGDRFDAKEVYMQIRKGKHYQFAVGNAEDYGCHYSYISGAATLIDGFTEKKTETE